MLLKNRRCRHLSGLKNVYSFFCLPFGWWRVSHGRLTAVIVIFWKNHFITKDNYRACFVFSPELFLLHFATRKEKNNIQIFYNFRFEEEEKFLTPVAPPPYSPPPPLWHLHTEKNKDEGKVFISFFFLFLHLQSWRRKKDDDDGGKH